MVTDTVFPSVGAQHVRIPVHEILFMETDDNCTRVECDARYYVVSRMLKDVLDEMASERLERIHRSYTIS